MMKNIFKNTEFLFGITSYTKLPDDVGAEVLLAGRSNAGKSSALNVLTDNPKLARISKTPGRTTEINFPSYFTIAVEFSLAVILATSIARDASLAQLMTVRADGAMAKARSLDSQQQTTRVLETTRFLTARRS